MKRQRRHGNPKEDRPQSSRGPQRMADVISHLMARHGYNQVQGAEQRHQLWVSVAGKGLASQTRAGNVKGGVWEIIVKNSVVLQELTFCKTRLLKEVMAQAPDQKIRDFRFRVGVVD